MANTPFDQQGLENAVDQSRALVDNANQLKSALTAAGAVLDKEFGSAARSISKNLNDLASQFERLSTNDVKRSDALKAQKKLEQDLVKLAREKEKLETQALPGVKKTYTEQKDAYNQLKDSLNTRTTLTRIEQEQLDIAKEQYIQAEKALVILNDTIQAADLLEGESRNQVASLQEYVKNWDKANLKIKAGAGILKGMGKIPIVGSIMDANKGLEAMQKSAAGGENAFKSFGKGISAAFEGIEKSSVILAIVGAIYKAIKFIVDLMFKADKQVTSIARNFVITKKEARGVLDAADGLATQLNLGDRLLAKMPEGFTILASEIVDTNLELNEMFNISADMVRNLKGAELGEKFITQLAVAKSTLNLTGEEVKGLTETIATFGGNVENTNSLIVQTGTAYNQITGFQINQKKTLKEVLTTTNLVKMSTKGGAVELAVAANNAMLLGLNLKEAREMGRGVLDFESSIQAQLESELLNSRELNLNRYRYLVLTNQTAAATDELKDLITKNADLLNGNVLAQESFAKAVGTSADKVADMVANYNVMKATQIAADKIENLDLQNKLGISKEMMAQFRNGALPVAKLVDLMNQAGLNIKDFYSEEIANTIMAQSAQDKWNKTLERAQEKFSILIANNGLIDQLVDFLQSFISVVSEKGLGGLFSIFGKSDIQKKQDQAAISRAQDTIKTYAGKKEQDLTKEQAADIRAANEIIMEKSASKPSDDPYGGGYSDFTIRPLPEDTINATGGNSGITIEGGTRLGRTDEMVAELKEQNRILMAILAKDTTIKVDGQTLANTVGVNVPVSYGNLLNPGSSTYYS